MAAPRVELTPESPLELIDARALFTGPAIRQRSAGSLLRLGNGRLLMAFRLGNGPIRANDGVVSGVAMVVDRSNGLTKLGVPMVSLIALQVETFEPDKLPPDLAKIPAAKPGSK